VGREMGVWAQEGCGSGDSARRLDLAGTGENRGNPGKHLIQKALQWKKMLDDGEVVSLSELAKKEGLIRARIIHIMNLLK
jgi:hypothetical protein